MVLCRRSNQSRNEIEQIEHEFIRVLCFDVESVKSLSGEVRQIARHDEAGPAADRRRQNTAIDRIWQDEPRDYVLVSCFARSQTKIENFQLSLIEKTGADQTVAW